jgi:HEAT repeat protein
MSKFPPVALLAGIVMAMTVSSSHSIDPQAISSPSKSAADATDSPAARLAANLAQSTGTRFEALLHNLRLGKGAEFTEALALAIPQLTGERQRRVRETLVKRLTRMKDTTLKEYLADENLEIRIAAAHACAIKGSKTLVPQLIPLLRDTRDGVAEAAHQALKELSGQDFGPKAHASREERLKATRQWSDWWNKQGNK